MNSQQPDTLAYYDANAQAFYDMTVGVEVNHLYRPFLALVPPGAHLLDAGCGSGRDSLFFKTHGYRVTAMEPSEEMARRSEALIGQEVVRRRFEDMDWHEAFDGIWACASLLHVPRSRIDDVFSRLTRALKPGGSLYASFKYGSGERTKKGRFFNDYDEAGFAELLARHPGLRLVEEATTEDVRTTTHQGERWLNVYLVRA